MNKYEGWEYIGDVKRREGNYLYNIPLYVKFIGPKFFLAVEYDDKLQAVGLFDEPQEYKFFEHTYYYNAQSANCFISIPEIIIKNLKG